MLEVGQSLIRLESVTKVFYTDEVETHALAGIHLELKAGEYVSIEGPSGCGKSTLLYARSYAARRGSISEGGWPHRDRRRATPPADGSDRRGSGALLLCCSLAPGC